MAKSEGKEKLSTPSLEASGGTTGGFKRMAGQHFSPTKEQRHLKKMTEFFTGWEARGLNTNKAAMLLSKSQGSWEKGEREIEEERKVEGKDELVEKKKREGGREWVGGRENS